jgi:hypothetical protein
MNAFLSVIKIILLIDRYAGTMLPGTVIIFGWVSAFTRYGLEK